MKQEVKDMMLFQPSVEFVDDNFTHGVFASYDPGTRVLEKGWQMRPGYKALECDIIFEKDVPVKMRDGVTIYTDILRPVTDEKVPGIIAWSPYGKASGNAPRYTNMFKMIGIPDSELSGLQKYEGPDPAWWCKHGYAVCHPDPRGIVHSEGDIVMLGSQEHEDCYDYIEWLAEQDWCNGKLALTGTSYLAMTQWGIAAERPPHLACINPTEGLQDAYRDWSNRGGIPDPSFMELLSNVNHVHAGGTVNREDIGRESHEYQFANVPLWEDKVTHPEKIECPALVIASYTNTLHTNGTFRAWRALGMKEKWLRIHNTQEWPDYYNERNQQERLKFFDRYLKDIDNGWENTPTVQYCLQDLEGGDVLNIPSDTFPPADTKYHKLYLNGGARFMSEAKTPVDIPVAMPTMHIPPRVPQASFIYKTDTEIDMIGYTKLKLWVETVNTDDMDIFVKVQKLDKCGHILEQINIPNKSAMVYDNADYGASVTVYHGTSGIQRLSMRHLDEEKTTDENPAFTFDRSEKLAPGEIVPVEVELSPIGWKLYAGEGIRLIVSTRNILGNQMPLNPVYTPNNKGMLVIHTGGEYESYLHVPMNK